MRQRTFIVGSLAALALVLALAGLIRSCDSMDKFDTQTWEEAESTGLSRDEIHEISEAVLRSMFEAYGSQTKPDAKRYCVKLFGEDAARGFLERFANREPPVRPGSAFVEGEDLLFKIVRIESAFLSGHKVYTEVYWGNVGTFGAVFTVKKKNGEWEVHTPLFSEQWVA